jgi:Tfp pilus assembly protein PilN
VTVKFNLAPEVYQTNQRNKQRRRTATTIGIVVNTIAVGLIILGLVVIGGQNIALGVLKGQVSSLQSKVTTYADLPDAVTAQQHLNTLGQLSQQQVYFSRFFSVLQSVAPQGVTVTEATVGADNSLNVTGTATTYQLVTKFADALAAYNVTVGANAAASQQPYFTGVTLGAVSSDSTSGGVDYKLTTQMSSQVTANGQ